MRTTSFEAESLNEFPAATSKQLRKIYDRACGVSDVSRHQMIERAGHQVSKIAKSYCSGIFPRVAVLMGKGHTGGVAAVAARCLASSGARIQLILSNPPEQCREETKVQLDIFTGWYPDIPVHDMSGISSENLPSMPECDIIVDGLLGTGIHGAPQEPLSTLIVLANRAEVPTISVDIPSGMDPDSGVTAVPTILATATVTFTIPKKGFLQPGGHSALGELFLVNIGACPRMVEQVISPATFPRNLPDIIYLYRVNSSIQSGSKERTD